MGCTDSKENKPPKTGGGDPKGTKPDAVQKPQETKRMKFVIIGNPEVGKTSLFHRFISSIWLADQQGDVDELMVTQTKQIDVNGKKVIIDVWDTAGQEKYRTITSSFYQGCVGALLVFDVSSKASFDVLGDWLVEARRYGKEALIILVGNKNDRSGEREVTREDAAALARKNNIEYVETSAKSGDGVTAAFEALTKLIMKAGDDDNRLGESTGPEDNGAPDM